MTTNNNVHEWDRIGPLAVGVPGTEDEGREGLYLGDCSCGFQGWGETKGGLRQVMAEHVAGEVV